MKFQSLSKLEKLTFDDFNFKLQMESISSNYLNIQLLLCCLFLSLVTVLQEYEDGSKMQDYEACHNTPDPYQLASLPKCGILEHVPSSTSRYIKLGLSHQISG